MHDSPELVVVGVGHVGLALAVEAVRTGLSVSGLDTDIERVAAEADGHTTSGAVDHEQVRRALHHGLRVTTDPACIAAAGTVVICVPTPLNRFVPDLSAVVRAAHVVAHRVRQGALVVLESTTYPGTTEEVIRPILKGAAARWGMTCTSLTRLNGSIPVTRGSVCGTRPRSSAVSPPPALRPPAPSTHSSSTTSSR